MLLGIYSKLFSNDEHEEHSQIVITLNNIASVYYALEQIDNALQTFQKVYS
jgi:hypothetical protein